MHRPPPRSRLLTCAILLAGAGCYSPAAPFGAPCATNGDCPRGQTCDVAAGVCGGPSDARTWRDDTAADFGAPGAVTEDAMVEAAGFVGPAAYLVGGLRVIGVDRAAITNPALASWDALAALPRAGTSLMRGLDLEATAAPPGVGLTHGDDITALVEGEIDLHMTGLWQFRLLADDAGFIEIARPGSDVFERVVNDVGANNTVADFTVTTAGWHRIRGAVTDRSLDLELDLRYDLPDPGNNFRRIPADRLRVRAGDVGGVLVDGFDDAFLVRPIASTVYPGTLGRLVFDADPFGLEIGSNSFSMRFASQILIDAAGKYALRIDSHHGHRAWLDGAMIADAFTAAPQISTTPAVELAPGWHDLVIDVHKDGGAASARLDVTVAEGPMWVGQPIPADHQRPIVGRGARWAANASTSTVAIPDMGSVTRTLTLDLPPGLVTTRIDAGFEVDHPLLPTVGLVLDPPVGANVTMATVGTLTGAGSHTEYAIVPAADAGTSWGFIASDTTADMMTGQVTTIAVTMIGAGGIAPLPTRYRYVSAARDLGAATELGPVRWALRQAPSADAAVVSIRTCDDPDACQAQPWTRVEAGARPAVPPRRFAQYAVELTSNGDVPTALDWIEIELPAR